MNETGRPGRAGSILARSVPFVLLAILYRGVPAQGFKADDFLVLRNLHGRTLTGVARSGFTDPFLGLRSLGLYRPLQSLSLGLDHAAFGPDARGFYADHLLWLAVVLGLLLAAASRLGLGPGATVLAGTLFVLHPLHPNVTAWISSRSYLFLEGSLLGILVLLPRGDRAPAPRPIRAWALGAVALGGALSHEIGLVLPVLAAVGVLLATRGTPGLPRRLAAIVPSGLALGLALLLRLLATGLFPWSPRPDVEALAASAPAFSWAHAAAGLGALALPARTPDAPAPGLRVLLLLPAALAALLGPIARPPRREELPPLFFLAATVILPALLPVSHGEPAPISGRHWFVATGPLVLLWSTLAMRPRHEASACRPRLDRLGGLLGPLAAACLALLFAPAQARSLAIHARAGQLARDVQESLARETRDLDETSIVIFFEPPMTLGDPPTAAPLPWSLGILLDPPFAPARRRPTILPAPLLPDSRAEALGPLLEPSREVLYLRYDATSTPPLRVVDPRFAHQVADRLVETSPDGGKDLVPLRLRVLRAPGSLPSLDPGAHPDARREAPGPEPGGILLEVAGAPAGTRTELVLASEVGARRFPSASREKDPALREIRVPLARLADEVQRFGVREAFTYAESMNEAGHVVARSDLAVLDLRSLGRSTRQAAGARDD